MILELIEQELIEQNQKEHKQKESHYPSEASKCIRAIWYSWQDVVKTNEMDEGDLLKCRIGDWIHAGCQENLKKACEKKGWDFQSELSGKTIIVGVQKQFSWRIDGIIKTVEGEKIGIEIKSTFGGGFRELKTKLVPKESDLMQVLLYSHFTNIKRWYLIYINREDAYRMEFGIKIDGDSILTQYGNLWTKHDLSINSILDKFKQIEKSIELPDRPYSVVFLDGEIKDRYQRQNKIYKSDWQCMYCSYLDHCWNDADRMDTWQK